MSMNVKISITQLRVEATSGRYRSVQMLANAFGMSRDMMKKVCALHGIALPTNSKKTHTTNTGSAA